MLEYKGVNLDIIPILCEEMQNILYLGSEMSQIMRFFG